MTIKEKLISFGIDIEKEKDLVNNAKEALKKADEKADKITTKLTIEGEKILNDLFNDKLKVSMPKKNVVRPKTIKIDEESVKEVTQKTSKIKINNSDNIENEKKSDNENSQSDLSVPFWKNKTDTNVKIVVKGQKNQSNKKDGIPKNGNPLPKSTIDELNRKKNEELNKKNNTTSESKTINNNQKVQINNKNKQVPNYKDNNVKNTANTNQNNISNQLKNNNQNQKNKKYNINGSQIKTTFIPSNANIATGTNNKFDGKKKKNKYDKDFENKKLNTKNTKSKDNKYKTNVNNYLNENEQVRKKKKNGPGAFIKPEIKIEKPEDEIKSIILPEVITIKDLASKLKMQPASIVKKLFLSGKIVTPNTELSFQEAENIALEYDILCEKEIKVDIIEELLKEDEEDVNTLVQRPPIVCVMGHVDHGKTSILDAIRNTNVISKEAGGITQHIGAYQVKINNRLITFLDTPGHEAFTAMRLRGAKSTDIAVLVVAADDGVKPQTIEAINHAKAANVEIVVAINKIDKPEANVERVKQQLSEYELIPADWGGSTTYCEVSAKQNKGITNLLEMILLTADVMDLKANPNRKARGLVIEAELDKGKGPVARVLVQKGTLKIGDYIAMGKSYGKVRAMSDCNGIRVKEALPAMPVEILGLNDVPNSGDTFVCFDNEKDARNFAETFIAENKQKLVEESKHKVTLEALFDQIKAGEVKELPIILKTDVVGSAEAIKNSLEKLSNDEILIKIIHQGVGNINESDVSLASASNAIIIGFNIKPESSIRSIIEKEKVDVRLYDVIYNAIDDVEKAMKGMLKPVFVEKVIGHTVIRQIFKASNVGNIAGCFVNDGEVRRSSKVRIYRKENLIFDGNILSLKRFKDEVKEVKSGFECGIVVEGFNDFVVDDTMEVYVFEEKNKF